MLDSPAWGEGRKTISQCSSLKTICYDKKREGAKAERLETASRCGHDATPVAFSGVQIR